MEFGSISLDFHLMNQHFGNIYLFFRKMGREKREKERRRKREKRREEEESDENRK